MTQLPFHEVQGILRQYLLSTPMLCNPGGVDAATIWKDASGGNPDALIALAVAHIAEATSGNLCPCEAGIRAETLAKLAHANGGAEHAKYLFAIMRFRALHMELIGDQARQVDCEAECLLHLHRAANLGDEDAEAHVLALSDQLLPESAALAARLRSQIVEA